MLLLLVDFIDSGRYVLEKLQIQMEVYYASEIDGNAINVSKTNFEGKVNYLGDVQKLTDKQIEGICPIDLLIGGSPCNDLSAVNHRRKGLFDLSGTGKLFFHFFRALKVINQYNGDRHLFWFFENVASMPKESREQIDIFLQRKSVKVDAKHFSPMRRARLYWGNLPEMYKPLPEELLKKEHSLDDSLLKACGREANVEKLNCITTNSNSLVMANGKIHPIKMNGSPDVPWITEIEKVFGFPAHYTDVGNIDIRSRQALLGKAWSAQVVSHLFSPLKSYFICDGEKEIITQNGHQHPKQEEL